jgi:tetratricopeptide (TPR) repeat protein
MAAVIGREFEFPLLHRASGLDEASAAEGVEELVRRRVLQGVGDRLEFVHHRLQTVAYGRLLPHRRKLLHRRAGEALEVLTSGALERDPLALGLHFSEAEVWEKAVSHLRCAGTQAAARSAYRQAVASFEEALAALRHLPETRQTLAQAVDLHLEARRALFPLHEMEAIFAHLQTAEAAAVTLGDQRRLAAVLANLTQYFVQVDELVRGQETGQRAVALADALDDFGLRVAANQYLGHVYLDRGAYRDAKAIFRRHAGELEGDLVRERFGMAGYPSVLYRLLLGCCHVELGEFIDGVALGEQALHIAEEIDQPYILAEACSMLGRIHLVQGEFARASLVLEAGLNIAEARHLGIPILAARLGYARAMSGQQPSGLRLLETAAARLREAKNLGRVALVSAYLGEAYLMAGRLADGADSAQRALTLARHQHQRGTQAWMLRLLGEIAAHENPPDAAGAEELYRQALMLAEELGMRPLAARCYLGLGRLYRGAGQDAAAKEHLGTARTELAQMEMHFWLEQAEAELTLT